MIGPYRRLPLLAMVLILTVSPGSVLAARADGDAERGPGRAEGVEFFEQSLRPVLAERCWGCHGGPAKTARPGRRSKVGST